MRVDERIGRSISVGEVLREMRCTKRERTNRLLDRIDELEDAAKVARDELVSVCRDIQAGRDQRGSQRHEDARALLLGLEDQIVNLRRAL